MSPTVILDHHGDLLARFSDSRFFAVLQGGYQQAHQSAGRHYVSAMVRQRDEQNAVASVNTLRQHVATAYNYRVTADMCTLLHHAAESLDDSDRTDLTLPPTKTGMVRFDVPVDIYDVRGRKMQAHWLIWGPVLTQYGGQATPAEALLLTWFNDNDFPDEVGRPMAPPEWDPDEMQRVMGRWNWIGSEIVLPDVTLGPSRITTPEHVKEEVRKDGDEPAEDTTNLIRYSHALWLMLNQTITKIDTEHPDRAGRRRAEKRKIPAQVQVIRLRRTTYPERAEGESHVEWQHRWFVRGHWAWRNCSAYLDGAQPYEKGYRRRVYIAGYVKGDESLPLVITDKVYSLDR